MSKAQTDIRTTSYDELSARPFGYQGTIDDVIAQIRAEPNVVPPRLNGRAELLMFLGADKVQGTGPSVEMDEGARYGAEEPGFYTLAYAQKHFPKSFYRAPDSNQDIADRMANLSDAQLRIFRIYRLAEFTVRNALAKAEAYPYPAAQKQHIKES